MSDNEVSDMWRDHKEESQQRRGSNREQSQKLLEEADIQFERKNMGAHLIVDGPDGKIDFWPGTGRWTVRKGKTAFGVFELIKFIKG